MGVPVGANFVPGLDNQAGLLRKRFDGVPGDEPTGLEVVVREELQQAWDADLAGEEAA